MGSDCPECGSVSKYTGWIDVISWTCGSTFDSEFHQSVLCREIEQLRTREAEKIARIAALEAEVEQWREEAFVCLTHCEAVGADKAAAMFRILLSRMGVEEAGADPGGEG